MIFLKNFTAVMTGYITSSLVINFFFNTNKEPDFLFTGFWFSLVIATVVMGITLGKNWHNKVITKQ